MSAFLPSLSLASSNISSIVTGSVASLGYNLISVFGPNFLTPGTLSDWSPNSIFCVRKLSAIIPYSSLIAAGV